VRGVIALNADWDFDEAERRYRRAIELAPSHVQSLQWLAELLMLSGHYDEALLRIQEAVRLDPASPLLLGIWGAILSTRGDYAEARRRFEESLRLDPAFAWVDRELAVLSEWEGRPDDAVRERRREMQHRHVDAAAMSAFERQVARDGLQGFRAWRLQWLQDQPAYLAFAPELIAEALAGLGRHEEAIDAIRARSAERGESLLHLLVRSPSFRDPRYRALAIELGLEELVIPVR
jgi:tetratricopeptide (TPR) repeat protein